MDDRQSHNRGLPWSTPDTTQAQTEAPKKPAFPSSLHAPTAPGANGAAARTQLPIYAGLLVGGIIAGVFLSAAWSRMPGIISDTASSTQKVSASAPTGKSSATNPPLVVADQPAGSSVAVSGVNISKPTWIVVYVSREGKPGNALGARLFFPADKQGSIGLLRDTTAGQSYFIGLSVDNGDRIFSLSKDLPLADADGGPLWETFRAR